MTKITAAPFGVTKNGTEVSLYTLANGRGAEVDICTYGGAIVAIRVPGRDGKLVDVALGYEDASGYENNGGFLGALIGRVGNRIGGAKFDLNGKTYQLNVNDGVNHLHGGFKGFDKQVWNARVEKDEALGEKLVVSYFSADGEERYPGNLVVSVTYSFNDANELKLEYRALGDQDTPVNLTNHCYFNLNGQGTSKILDHEMTIFADAYTEGDAGCLPTGVIAPVEGTPFDFKTAHVIGDRIDSDFEQLTFAGGYDHNFVIRGEGYRPAAKVKSGKTGIVMEVFTDMPGMQFYAGNMISGDPVGKGGCVYKKRDGFCLETQYYPNGMACPNFPSPVLKAGEPYHFTTAYRFSAE